jgi:hypothetical protein
MNQYFNLRLPTDPSDDLEAGMQTHDNRDRVANAMEILS